MKKTAPAHVISELKRFDPDLRIRWSSHRGCWAVDRRMDDRRIMSAPVRWIRNDNGGWDWRLLPELDEKYVQYHDRYINILYSKFVDRRLFQALFAADAWRAGYKGKYYFKDSDREEVSAERKRKQKGRELIDETGKEALGFMRWRDGERISLYGNGTGNNTHS